MRGFESSEVYDLIMIHRHLLARVRLVTNGNESLGRKRLFCPRKSFKIVASRQQFRKFAIKRSPKPWVRFPLVGKNLKFSLILVYSNVRDKRALFFRSSNFLSSLLQQPLLIFTAFQFFLLLKLLVINFVKDEKGLLFPRIK